MKTGCERIAAERKRQIEVEGLNEAHDSSHRRNELVRAAACYALDERSRWGDFHNFKILVELWPWTWSWWKPTPENRIRELEKAGALIAAEIDRLQAIGGDV